MATALFPEDSVFCITIYHSLQATWIRNTLLQALRQNQISVANVAQNFVYSAPTISGLAKFLVSLSDPSINDFDDHMEARAKGLQEMVAKYTADFPAHHPTAPAPNSEVALLTGSTGGLGSAVLAHLVTLPSVSRIYAFNRKTRGGASVRDRQLESLKDRGLDVGILDSPKVVLVEGDTARPDLGISEELYAEVSAPLLFIIELLI